jgi:hypothetical protein
MADKPAKRQRRQHLKNVRRASKDHTPVRKKSSSAQAAAISGGNVMLTLGLIVTSVVLLLFLASAFMQYGFNYSGGSGSSESQATGQAAALPAVERSTIEIRVLNGCGIPGASRQMTTRVRDLGFDVVIADNADHFGYEHTLVVDHTDRTEVGRTVAGALGCGQLSAQHDEMAMAHVTVILGMDWENFLGRAAQTEGKQDKDWIDQLNGKMQQLLEQ